MKKGNMILATTLGIAAMSTVMMSEAPPVTSNPKLPDPEPESMTAEQMAEELKKRVQKFRADLDKYNENRRKIGKTKDFEINGIIIASSNSKNAVKAFKKLLRENALDYQPLQEKPIETDEEYQICLQRFSEVFNAVVGTAESVEADILAKRISAYEEKHFPLEERTIQPE